MSSTTENLSWSEVDGQTPGRLRQHLRMSRQRIATLIGMLDDERAKHAEARAELRVLRRRLEAAHRALSGIDSRSG